VDVGLFLANTDAVAMYGIGLALAFVIQYLCPVGSQIHVSNLGK